MPMKKIALDHHARCSCKHTLGLHSYEHPRPCRARDCECEGFFRVNKKDGRIITLADPTPRKTKRETR